MVEIKSLKKAVRLKGTDLRKPGAVVEDVTGSRAEDPDRALTQLVEKEEEANIASPDSRRLLNPPHADETAGKVLRVAANSEERKAKENVPLASSPGRLSRKTVKRLDQFRRVEESVDSKSHPELDQTRVRISDSEIAPANERPGSATATSSGRLYTSSGGVASARGKPAGQSKGLLTAATLDTILNKLQKAPLATKTKMPARAAKAASFLDDLNFDEDFDF